MKNELLKDKTFRSIYELISAVTLAVDFYNSRRPHMSIGMKAPAVMAESAGYKDMRWHSYRQEAIKNRDNKEKSTFTSNNLLSRFNLNQRNTSSLSNILIFEEIEFTKNNKGQQHFRVLKAVKKEKIKKWN